MKQGRNPRVFLPLYVMLLGTRILCHTPYMYDIKFNLLSLCLSELFPRLMQFVKNFPVEKPTIQIVM